ncbi:MAG TPA: class A beta-lactamase [Steroidobacteraceae bacterium]|nr:class A beta-lactamase [Steroidobacteraceae bacterium]
MIARRELLGGTLAAAVAGTIAATMTVPALAAERGDGALKRIRERVGGRLGVHALDSQSGKRWGLDENSRYAMASTFKLPLAAAILWQVDRKAFTLDHTLVIGRNALVPHSPVLEAKIAAGADAMTIRDLCGAILTESDNAAANVLLNGIGGPRALTTFFRSLGDEVSRLDRREPDVNTNLPGDLRDTTTPRAMVDSMLRIFTQDVLTLPSRALLIDWMIASRTGLDRVRAGIPKSWNPGDKSGTGEAGAFNDLVIAYPPNRRPVFVAVYMSDSKLGVKELAAAHAEIGSLVGKVFAETKT